MTWSGWSLTVVIIALPIFQIIVGESLRQWVSDWALARKKRRNE